MTGIEPVTPTWKDGMLPLHHIRKAGKEGLEPPTNALEVRGSIHLSYLPLWWFLSPLTLNHQGDYRS